MRHSSFLLFIFWFCTGNLKAQPGKVDSLISRLSSVRSDEQQIDLLKQLSAEKNDPFSILNTVSKA